MKLLSLLIVALPLAAQVVGVGNFIHVVANLDKSIEFYHDLIGLELNGDQGPRPFALNAPVTSLYNAPGLLRFATMKVPNSDMNVEVVEFKEVAGKPVRPRLQDPGATMLTLTVPGLDSVLTRLKKGGVQVDSEGLVKDPDGFFVKLLQGDSPGASFAVTVEDTEKTLRFYREALGFQPKIATTTDGQYRRSTALVPGTSFQMEFLEFKGDRKPVHPAIHDPGAAVLRLRVRDVESAVKILKAAGAPVVSIGGEIVNVGKNRAAIVADLNNLFIQTMQTAP